MIEDIYKGLVDRCTRTILMSAVLLITVLIYKHVGVTSADLAAVTSTLSSLNKKC